MAEFKDVPKDVYNLLEGVGVHNSKTAAHHAMNIGIEFGYAIEREDRPREKGKLWASDLGKPCLRQHWYKFNGAEPEPIQGHTRFKFLYGNVIEEAALYLTKEAGHNVECEQQRISVTYPSTSGEWTVTGKVDAVIDGVLIDVKSTSPHGFKKYSEDYSMDANNDSFGYLYQLGFYNKHKHLLNTPTILTDEVGFLWVDKQNGHLAASIQNVPSPNEVKKRIYDIINAVYEKELDVPKAFSPERYGKSGNMKLPVACSYCPFKQQCWRDANNGQGLRTFLYSHGPVHFTDIKRQPSSKVPEITHA